MDFERMSAVVGDMVATMAKVRENTETLAKHLEDILFVVQEKIEGARREYEFFEQAQPAEAKPTPTSAEPHTLEDKLDFIVKYHPSLGDLRNADWPFNDPIGRKNLMSNQEWMDEFFEAAWHEYLRLTGVDSQWWPGR